MLRGIGHLVRRVARTCRLARRFVGRRGCGRQRREPEGALEQVMPLVTAAAATR
jgi:hypothetical protein